MKITFRNLLPFFAILLAACAAPAATLPAPEVSAVEEATAPPADEVTAILFPLTLTDDLQNSITLDSAPQRILSLAPSNTEILFALGAGAQVAGRDATSDFPAEAAQVPDVGDPFSLLDTTLIASLEPDLALAAEATPPEQVAQLQQMGIPVFWMADPLDVEGLYANIEAVGQLTGRVTEAATLVSSLQSRLTAVQVAVQGAQIVTVFYELDASDPAAPFSAGAGTFADLLLVQAGGQNVASQQGEFVQVPIADLQAANPDVILLGDSNYGVTADSVGSRPGWEQLNAVQNGRVFAFDDKLVNRPGPRWIDAIEQLAAILYPDLFN
jgi:iron complex transport system substrate-binding protein